MRRLSGPAIALARPASLPGLLDALESAACRDAPLSIFFPEQVTAEAVEYAVWRFCDRCPVWWECWQYTTALESGGALDVLYGIVAGMGPQERRAEYARARGRTRTSVNA